MRRAVRIALVAYLLVVGVGVFGPAPGEELDAAAQRLQDLEQEVRDRVGRPTTTAEPGPSATAPPAAPSSGDVPEGRWFDDLRAEPFFNVVVFVPLGVLFPLAWPRWRWLTVLVGAQLSGTIELVQDVVLDWRSPTVEDVRWNTLGTAIGFACWLSLRLAVPRLEERLSSASKGDPPRRGPGAVGRYSGNIPRRGSSV